MTEDKKTAVSYVLNFYNEIIALKHNFSVYVNVLVELDYKFGDFSKVPEPEKEVFTNSLQNLRYTILQSYSSFSAIKPKLKNLDKELVNEINTLYSKFKMEFMINRDDIDKYVIDMNKILVDEVIQGILETNLDIIQDIYNMNPNDRKA